MSEVFEIIRRDDTDLELTFTDVDGNAIDLTGCTVFFTAKRRVKDVDDDAVISTELDEFEEPETGICVLPFTNEETDIPAGNYYYDVQLLDSEGKIASSVKGLLRVLSDVTIRTE